MPCFIQGKNDLRSFYLPTYADISRYLPSHKKILLNKVNNITMVPGSMVPNSNHRKGVIFLAITALLLCTAYFISLPSAIQKSINAAASARGVEDPARSTALDNNKHYNNSNNTVVMESGNVEITLGEVTYGSVINNFKQLPYYHCGPSAQEQQQQEEKVTELVLLHGAAFSKEDWKTSGILEMFCQVNNNNNNNNNLESKNNSGRRLSSTFNFQRPLSVTALDFPVSSYGSDLQEAFESLTAEHVLSGNPVTILSPSASGKAIISLGEMSQYTTSIDKSSILESILKAWIPVASGSVLTTYPEALQEFKNKNVEILAIYGDMDNMGKEATKRLVDVSDARGVELKGRHPVYLDSPEEFVEEVLRFLEEKDL